MWFYCGLALFAALCTIILYCAIIAGSDDDDRNGRG